MKKLITSAICLCAFIMSANIMFAQDEPEFKNYNMISGYVEYKLTGASTGTQELYFEEWGKYEAKISKGDYDYMGQKGSFNGLTITTPDAQYRIDLDKSKGMKGPAPDWTKIIEMFENENGNFDKVQELSMKEAGFIKKGNEKFLDRDCVLWEADQNGANIKIWLWKGIELKTVTNAQGVTSTIEAINIVEEKAVPFAKFEPPSGIEWLDPKTGQPIKEEKK